MTLVVVSPPPVLQFLDDDGIPLSGAQLFTYAGGTTNKTPTYTDASGATPNTNPIVLDLFGKAPSAIFLPPTTKIKFVLAPAGDSDPPTAPIWTVDNVAAPTTAAGSMSLQDADSVSITGGSILVGTLQCIGATQLASLAVSNDADFSGDVNIDQTLTVADAATFNGAVTSNANITVMSRSLSVQAVTGFANLQIAAYAAGFTSALLLQTGDSTRWGIAKDNTSESGSNTGSDFNITAHDDTGAVNFIAINISRASGLVTLETLLINVDGGWTLKNQSNGAAGQAGTLANAPSAGDPTHWIPATVNGTAGFIPFWAA